MTEDLDSLNNNLKQPLEILKWLFSNYKQEEIALACSFGSPEAICIIDMLSKLNKTCGVFFIDTGRLHEETYQVLDRVRNKYKIEIETYFPDYSKIQKMVDEKGFFHFYESVQNRKQCCYNRKVEPLQRALNDTKVWVSGIRKDQSNFRSTMKTFENNQQHNVLKVNPVFNWTIEQIWEYVKENNVPYNTLHNQNYGNIGCQPCTRSLIEGEGTHAGKWWWEQEQKKECGLHIMQGETDES